MRWQDKSVLLEGELTFAQKCAFLQLTRQNQMDFTFARETTAHSSRNRSGGRGDAAVSQLGKPVKGERRFPYVESGEHEDPSTIDDIRRELGWHLIEAARKSKDRAK